ncbi:hypothetical protein [Vibrio sp. ECSMB14106]|uniref:hypothetical protein n=1 Tax=Vibrio sp. ECSMB14106 TaxID=1638949 RepID=UPI000B10DAE1|nr:hypothetical protein [Vibrio sp. ECSMB14106]
MADINKENQVVTHALIGSSFFLIYAPVSPVSIWILCLILICIMKRRLKVNTNILCALLVFLSLTIKTYYFSNSLSFQPIYYLILSFAVYLIFESYSSYFNVNSAERSIRSFTIFMLVFCSIDTVLRFVYPNELSIFTEDGSKFWFYQYKTSWILSDSNSVAILLLNCLFLRLVFHFKYYNRIDYSIINFLVFVLICLTLSRAAILAAILGFGFIIFYKGRNIYFKLGFLLPALTLLLSYFLYLVVGFSASDGSGSTKLHEFGAVVSFIENSTLSNLLFGVGFGNGELYSGRYLHGLYSKLVIEGGLIATLVFCLAILFIVLRNRHVSLYLFPLIVCSFSFSFYIVVPFYIASIMLLFVEN